MAKLSKKQRQQQKQKQVRKLKSQGYSAKQIQSLSNAELNKQYNRIREQERVELKRKEKVRKKRESAKRLQTWKYYELERQGVDTRFLTSTNLRKVKKKDIEKGNVSRETYVFLYEKGFDFNKRYTFPKGRGLYIAWLDYSGEQTIAELMQKFNRFSNETLIEFLRSILNTPKQYSPSVKDSGSSGRAGNFRMAVTNDKIAVKMLSADNNAIKKSLENRKKKRTHTGVNTFYQCITEDGNPTIKSITGRELLIIANAIFYNITEDARDKYGTFYKNIVNNIPAFAEILPVP